MRAGAISRWSIEMQSVGLESRHDGRIRNATLLDTCELSRLLGKASTSRAEPLDLLAHGHLLVLELGKAELGAAVHVDVAGNCATVNLLVVDPSLRGRHVAERMSGVARALCEAYGYTVDECTGGPARAAYARGRR